jgi:hypothetical protein
MILGKLQIKFKFEKPKQKNIDKSKIRTQINQRTDLIKLKFNNKIK